MLAHRERLPFLGELTEISGVMDLQPFLHTLVEIERQRTGRQQPEPRLELGQAGGQRNRQASSCQLEVELESAIDRMIESDFLEPIVA